MATRVMGTFEGSTVDLFVDQKVGTTRFELATSAPPVTQRCILRALTLTGALH